MSSKVVTFILIMSLVFLISCGEDKSVSPPKRSSKNEIVPLSIGNYWKYKYTDYEDSNEVIKLSEEFITKDTVLENETRFVIEQKGSEFNKICYNNSFGYNQTSNNYEQFVKYPTFVGDYFLFNDLFDSVKVISMNKKITLPAGTFECYHYQSFDKYTKVDENGVIIGQFLFQFDLYYSVGVGLVLTNTFNIQENKAILVQKQELIEYNVK